MPQPFDPARQPQQLVLANGLRVRLLHMPNGAQAAALVRVHTGAHDAPAAYPGLAHFLEHLVFLGSRDYCAADGLMPFVQGCGGQLNASTRERHTDFFFQLPADRLQEALLRLLDMLAHPLLDPAAQLREREVLQAEFHARAQDAETLCDAALGQLTDPNHPFSAFHAGNRDTLPVESAAFQQALRDYHQRFYRAGQMELLLAGPEDALALMRLAEQADSRLASGAASARRAPPLGGECDAWLRLQLPHGESRLQLAFFLERLPEHAAPALDYLSAQLASEAVGGLCRRLREAGWCRSIKVRVPYMFDGQSVAVVELMLTEQGLQARATVIEAVLDWLRFYRTEIRRPQGFSHYRQVLSRRLQRAEPLARLKHWVEPLAWRNGGDDEAIAEALHAIIGQMLGVGPRVVVADSGELRAALPLVSRGFALRLAFDNAPAPEPHRWNWQQPPHNRWLNDPAGQMASKLPGALRWLGPEDAQGQGALFLCWQFLDAQPPAALWHALAVVIETHNWAAEEAGVSLRLENSGAAWCLELQGYARAIPAILGDILPQLTAPPVSARVDGVRRAERDDRLGGEQMLIRQLLMQLPRLLAAKPDASAKRAADLQQTWQAARWHGLAVGLPQKSSGPLAESLSLMPGEPAQAPSAAAVMRGKHWHRIGGTAGRAENACLLFYPLPDSSPATEAGWRLLAQQLEAAFFRRLRSELQLGYAVFSRFHSAGVHAGLLFGVQSPTASAQEIIAHIQAFFGEFATRLENQSDNALKQAAIDAANRYKDGEKALRTRAERTWQGCLGGHDVDRAEAVAAAMGAMGRAELIAALASVRQPDACRVVLSTDPAPA